MATTNGTGPRYAAHLEPRLAAVETSVQNLSNDMSGVRVELRALGERTHLELQSLARAISDGQRTNWSTILSAVGLAIVIIGAIGTAYVSPLSVMIENNRQVNLDQEAHLARKNAEIHEL